MIRHQRGQILHKTLYLGQMLVRAAEKQPGVPAYGRSVHKDKGFQPAVGIFQHKTGQGGPAESLACHVVTDIHIVDPQILPSGSWEHLQDGKSLGQFVAAVIGIT